MTLATAIVQVIASILAYLSARGIDHIVGKWVAYFTIAWQKVASDRALATYQETMNALASSMPDKWKEWEDWRNGKISPID